MEGREVRLLVKCLIISLWGNFFKVTNKILPYSLTESEGHMINNTKRILRLSFLVLLIRFGFCVNRKFISNFNILITFYFKSNAETFNVTNVFLQEVIGNGLVMVNLRQNLTFLVHIFLNLFPQGLCISKLFSCLEKTINFRLKLL